MKVTVVGPGRWGSCIAWYLNKIGKDVTLYGRSTSSAMQKYLLDGVGEYITMPESVRLSVDLNRAVNDAEIIVISIPSQNLRAFLDEFNNCNIENKIIVLCMKGIEISSGKRLSEVAQEVLNGKNKIAVWLGPGHVQEFYKGIPNCMVIDSEDKSVTEYLVSSFSSNLIRFYYGNDLIGNEIGAAAKNVIGIAAGLLDGSDLTTLKGPLMSRGTREIARLIKAMGGNELSAYGLCHLGDYEATVFSNFSHNRSFGEAYAKGEKFEHLAEGYFTVKALMKLSEKYNEDLPICHTVYRILYENLSLSDAINALFARTLKLEF